MKVTIHVPTIADVAEARAEAEAQLAEGDELEIVVGTSGSRPVERQPVRQAVGYPPNGR